MVLINCEINLLLTWYTNYIIPNATTTQATTFAITETKLYDLVVTLSTNDNEKLFATIKIRIQMHN